MKTLRITMLVALGCLVTPLLAWRERRHLRAAHEREQAEWESWGQ